MALNLVRRPAAASRHPLKTLVIALAHLGVVSIVALPAFAPVSAQAQNVAQEHHYAISAGPLTQALSQFGREAGVMVSYTPELTDGKTSPGVQGQHSPASALARLLAGTDLEAAPTRSGSFVLRRVVAADGSVTALPTVTVQGNLDSVTENSGSYTTGATTVATKMEMSLKETPRSVSVITNQQLKDQGLEGKNLEDVLRYAPGITLDDTMQGFQELGVDKSMPRIYSRGQQITNLQIDGLTIDLSGANGAASINTADYGGKRAAGLLSLPDMVLFDHVEIVRGPNSVFSGNGSPSATINMTRKKPLREFQLIGELSGTSWSNNSGKIGGRGTFDVTGALPIWDGRIRGRFIASKADGAASFLDHHRSERETFYAALEADLAPDTVLGVNVSNEKIDSTGLQVMGGLPRYHWGDDIGLPVGSNFTNKDAYTDVDSQNYQVYFKHAFDQDWNLSLTFGRTEQKLKTHGLYWQSSNIYEDNSGARLKFAISAGDKKISQDNIDIHVNGAFDLMGRDVKVLFGADAKKLEGRNYMTGHYDNAPARDIDDIRSFDWNYDYQLSKYFYDRLGRDGIAEVQNDSQKEIGLYGAVKINIADPLNLFISGRYAQYENKSIYTGRPVLVNRQSHDTGRVSLPIMPTYAITYDLNRNITAYISHSRSYQDQSSHRKGVLLDASNPWNDQNAYIVGDRLDPIVGKNWELGVNGEFFDGRLNASATLFSMTRTGIAAEAGFGFWNESTPAEYFGVNCCYTDDGRQESKGIDLGVSGEVYPGVSLSAGYTFNRNETKSGFASPVDPTIGADKVKTHTRTPEHQLKIWAHYKPRGEWRKWNIGVGVVAQSKAYSSGTAAEYLGHDPNRVFTNSAGEVTQVGGSVYSNDAYYTTGAGGGLGYNAQGKTYTLPYDFTQGAYAVFNASVGYEFNKHWYAQLNVDNIFDKRYYRTIGTSTGGNYYGAPRSFTLTLRGTF